MKKMGFLKRCGQTASIDDNGRGWGQQQKLHYFTSIYTLHKCANNVSTNGGHAVQIKTGYT